MILFPQYLLPLESLEYVEVIGDIREKVDSDSVQKTESWSGEQRKGWLVPIEVIRGTKMKTLPNGKQLETLETEQFKVTVWMHEKPDFKPGDYVNFTGLSVGAMGGNLYLQALGIEKKDIEFDLDFGRNSYE